VKDTHEALQHITIQHFVTLTWSDKTNDWKEDIRRLMKPLARQWGTHIFVEGFLGIQEKRLKKYNRRLPDVHLLVGYENMIDDVLALKHGAQIERRWINTNTGRKYRRSEVLDFELQRNTWSYLYKHDDDHMLEVFCPRKRKCRRAGCVYRKDMSLWTMRPGDSL
jgi:hypothetical protein